MKQKNNLEKLNDTQKLIFQCIEKTPMSKQMISEKLKMSFKTISNNLPKMAKLLDNYDIIRNFDKNNFILFSAVPKTEWIPKIQKKIYSYNRSASTPYIVYNLPSPPKGYNYWKLYAFGDFHYGSNACDYKKVERYINEINKQPNAIAILMGDLTENSNKDSIAEGVFVQTFPPQEQQEKLTKLLAPIAHKILFGLLGNHGDRTVKSAYLSPERNIANALEIEFFDGMMFFDIICQNHKWEATAIHGRTGAATIGGRINAVTKQNTFHNCDFYFMGHTHDKQLITDLELLRNPKAMRLEVRERIYILTGGFLKHFYGYPNKKGLPPLPLGVPHVLLYCDHSNYPGKFSAQIDPIKYISGN